MRDVILPPSFADVRTPDAFDVETAKPATLQVSGSEPSTVGLQEVPQAEQPHVVRARSFGKRAFRAVGYWEGVVEEISGTELLVRLVPVVDGRPQPDDVNVTVFSVDELEADGGLVQPGTMLYWTLGREANDAGSVKNASLLRIRRTAPPSEYQHLRAEQEAEAILRALGGGGAAD